jgi:hypothetical protein
MVRLKSFAPNSSSMIFYERCVDHGAKILKPFAVLHGLVPGT